MSLLKKLLLTVGDEKIIIDLLWADAPRLCQKVWDNLPVESAGTVAKLCNHELIFPVPFQAERENMQEVKPGCVGWWDIRTAVNVWFGDPGPNGPLAKTSLFGKVSENLEGLARQGQKMFIKPGTKVRMERYEV